MKQFRLSVLLFLLASLALAIASRTEITGTGAAVQVASSGAARWVQVIADPGNTSPVAVSLINSTINMTAGNVFLMQGTGSSVTLTNSTLSGNYGITFSGGTGGIITSSGNTFGGLTGNYYYYTNAATVTSNNNNFGTPGAGQRFTVAGVGKTYTQWKALGFDAASTP